MKYLLDTDHISVLQQQSGTDYNVLCTRMAQYPPADLALSVVSFHEQVLGCHTYIARARTSADLVRGFAMLARLLSDYMTAVIVPFDAAAAAMLDSLLTKRLRIAAMDLRIASIALAHGLILVTHWSTKSILRATSDLTGLSGSHCHRHKQRSLDTATSASWIWK
jgi:tRNA(fMet)-specific endonuclease VapC